MPSTARLELEIDVVEKRRQALDAGHAYKGRQQAAAGRGGYRKSHLEAALLHEDPLVAVGVNG